MIRLPLKLPELVNSPQQPKGVCIATFGSFAQATVRVAWCTFPVLAAPSRMSSCSTKKGKEGKQGKGHGHSRIQGSGGRGQSGTWLILFWPLTLFAGSAACRPPGSAEMRIAAASASAACFERMEAFCGFFSRSRAVLASCWTAGRGQEHACMTPRVTRTHLFPEVRGGPGQALPSSSPCKQNMALLFCNLPCRMVRS